MKGTEANITAACLSGLLLIIVACEKPEDAIGFVALGLIAIVAAITYTVGKTVWLPRVRGYFCFNLLWLAKCYWDLLFTSK